MMLNMRGLDLRDGFEIWNKCIVSLYLQSNSGLKPLTNQGMTGFDSV